MAVTEKKVTEKAAEAAKASESTKKEAVKAGAEKIGNAAKATVTKTASKAKATVKKTAVKAKAKISAAKDNATSKVYVQYAGNEVLAKDVLERAREAYIAEGHSASGIKSIQVYIKPEENAAFYVINNNAGRIDLF